jgi:phosphoribosylaminoimidazole carboxylase (NCAIR synthetase)
MTNILGKSFDENGLDYSRLKKLYDIKDVKYTFYGKKAVSQNRKMGHAVILSDDHHLCLKKLNKIKTILNLNQNE